MAWRQHRAQLLVTTCLIAAIAAVMTYYRFDMLDYLGRCEAAQRPCAGFYDRYQDYFQLVQLVLLALPALVGMFTGGPLFARDIEQGTHVLSLGQSVGRTRWWATKLLVGGLPVVVAMVGLGLLATWALAPVSDLVGFSRMQQSAFEIQGLVVGAYTVLGLAVGATAGLLFRRGLAAMVLTLVVYLVLLVGVATAARPHYAEPAQAVTGVVDQGADRMRTVESELVPGRDMRVGITHHDQHGNPVAFNWRCLSSAMSAGCPQHNGPVTEVTSYHPASRFWAYQAIESGLYLALGTVVLGLGWWRLRRRVL